MRRVESFDSLEEAEEVDCQLSVKVGCTGPYLDSRFVEAL